ncbi:hypothetical protein FHS83_003194 [Rhizomicrobium palustre]|uniref:Pyrroline-5-carboxylate reductase catalytic N-terminal domain-containing protein n=1 Tax=Rhizomicrobium palustre TaxID=189966 RepID=A0A846N2B4_9PROT|nr:NAD(P)-binding domain-containing protein [Rhizomicrobium palustre]NIK89876.1 hypothetical protein [Rhizomicrobium palustre]
MRVGIVGAGHIGQSVARVAVKAGHSVLLSNSRGPESISVVALAIGAKAGTVEEAAAFGDIVVLAIPLHAYSSLDARLFDGKIALDTGNYYPNRDGEIGVLETQAITTSQYLARYLPGAQIVKAFNAILAAHILRDVQPAGSPGRRALPIAGDDAAAKSTVSEFVDSIGFDVVDLGPLSESWKIERARPAYCIPLDKVRLETTLAATERDSFVPEGSWRG